MLPKELDLIGVFVPPLFVVMVIAVVAATATALLLNRYRLSRFFINPPLVFVAIIAIYVVLIGTFIIPI